MTKKTKIIIGTFIIIILIILGLIYFIFIILPKPPDIVDIDWGSSNKMIIEHTPLWVRALKVEETEYVFYSAKNIDNDNISLFYI